MRQISIELALKLAKEACWEREFRHRQAAEGFNDPDARARVLARAEEAGLCATAIEKAIAAHAQKSDCPGCMFCIAGGGH